MADSAVPLKQTPLNIMWFRRDLRLRDNPAFHEAVLNGNVIAVYTLCESQWDEHRVSLAQRALIKNQLISLEAELSNYSIPLVVINTQAFKRIPKALVDFAEHNNSTSVFFNEEYELNEQNLSRSLISLAMKSGVGIKPYHEQCLMEPGSVLNKQGEPYKVFTAFKKTYLSELSTRMRPLYALPKAQLVKNKLSQSTIAVSSDLTALQAIEKFNLHTDFVIESEHTAHDYLNEFCNDRIMDYKSHRDFPAIDGTSKLSTCLTLGVLSVRQCYQAAQQTLFQSNTAAKEGIETWVSELIWRDFYRHLIFLFPELCKFKPFKIKTNQLPWKHDQKLFKAWKEGRTGYPIVDAAMRQLKSTGWMHNRLRMVVAMFLTKHLFIDWRWGEEYFMTSLIDADFASNNGGWQWSASTGVDAVPYFRIFNPTRQSERFDSEGLFIRKYVPELAELDNKSIHKPSEQQLKQLNYMQPIVNHSESVKQTKAWFKELDTLKENQT